MANAAEPLPQHPPLDHAGERAALPPAAVAAGDECRWTDGPPPATLDFPGCRAFNLPACQVDTYEGRLELWDRDTETAFVVREGVSSYHEVPIMLLAELTTHIAEVRGAGIRHVGAMDLVLREPPSSAGTKGERRRLMQADQCVYLDQERGNKVGPELVVGDFALYPDVVLEVDLTTDIRRNKLRVYEAWGFPEVWVDVPERQLPSSRQKPGLTIRVLEGGKYRISETSRAFPSLRAEEMHQALNEGVLSEATAQMLERVGRLLGAREGTRPEDHVFARRLREQSHEEGWHTGRSVGEHEGRLAGRKEGLERGRAEGLRQGRAAGVRDGRREAAITSVREVFVSRGLSMSRGFPRNVPGLADTSLRQAVRAACACADEANFRARIGAGDRR